MNDTDQLVNLLREEYSRSITDNQEDEFMSPDNLAEKVYSVIDPAAISPHLVHRAAFLELKQLARSICRTKFEEIDTRQPLFEYRLQPRYPAVRDGEEVYVLRAMLTIAERRENSKRLRKEGIAKTTHADALDAETDDLIRRGLLAEEESA